MNRLSQLFEDMLSIQQLHSAAQLVVRQDGRTLLNLAGGSGPYQGRIDADTPFLTFSVSKALTGLCVHHLIETGCIDLDAPVAEYWPEFGQGGKETATIRHVFLHQAGIPAPHLNRQVFLWPSWSLVTRGIARQPALFAPGSKTAYHLVNYGFIFGEIVRRVSGKPIDVYLREHFLEPLGLKNTWLRLPARALRRSPRLETSTPSMRSAVNVFNLPIIRTALIPAAGLHSTASDLAQIFQMLLDGGEFRGQRLLQPETIARAVSSGYHGWDDYLKSNMHWGLGFVLNGSAGPARHLEPDRTVPEPGRPAEEPRTGSSEPRSMGKGSCEQTYGAFGMGTSMVWVDPCARLVVAFTCNGMLSDQRATQRWAAISDAVWEIVGSE